MIGPKKTSLRAWCVFFSSFPLPPLPVPRLFLFPIPSHFPLTQISAQHQPPAPMSPSHTPPPSDTEETNGKSSPPQDDRNSATRPPSAEKEIVSSLSTSTQLQELPVEVWGQICKYLYPSQLIRLGWVSQVTRKTVCSLRVWSQLFTLVHSDNPNIRLALLLGLPESQSYMYYMNAISPKICEQCYKYCPFESDFLEEMPLRIPAPSQTQSTEQVLYVGEYVDPTFKIHACLNCRKQLFKVYEEPIRYGIRTNEMTLVEAQKVYPYTGLTASSTRSLVKLHGSFRQSMFLKIVRASQGGDVGVEASSEVTYDHDERTRKRIQQYADLHHELLKIK